MRAHHDSYESGDALLVNVDEWCARVEAVTQLAVAMDPGDGVFRSGMAYNLASIVWDEGPSPARVAEHAELLLGVHFELDSVGKEWRHRLGDHELRLERRLRVRHNLAAYLRYRDLTPAERVRRMVLDLNDDRPASVEEQITVTLIADEIGLDTDELSEPWRAAVAIAGRVGREVMDRCAAMASAAVR